MSKFITKLTTTTIFTTKTLKSHIDSLRASNHMSALHQQAKINPNFIRASSYWNHDLTKIHTISHWTGSHGWEEWLGSKERYSTYGQYEKEMYEYECHERLTEIVRSNNIFLL